MNMQTLIVSVLACLILILLLVALLLFVKAKLTPSGTVAHVHVAWADFFDSLPVDGVDWRFGVIRSGASGTISSGGVVHELSRSLVVHFNFTPAQLAALRRDKRRSHYCSNRHDALPSCFDLFDIIPKTYRRNRMPMPKCVQSPCAHL